MTIIGHILMLAVCLTSLLYFGGAAVLGVIHGRLKVEPSQDWIDLRKQPIKFVVVILFYIGLVLGFATVTIQILAKIS